MGTSFKLRSGNASAFKNLGSSPAKQDKKKKKKEETNEERRIREVDEAIERGDVLKPDTKELLKKYKQYIFQEKLV